MGIQLLFISLCLMSIVYCYPKGAPKGACDNLLPSHDEHKTKNGAAPYAILSSKNTVTAGQKITVTVRGLRNKKFRGLLLVARQPKSNVNLGEFTASNNTKTLECKRKGDSITHKSPEDKTITTFQWTAPNNFKGQVNFIATIVKDFDEYWTNVKSSTVTIR